ncbi:MAG: sodium-dependent transporter [Planctomycetota bacterium]
MAELLEEQRENWGSRGGFVLAAIGSAVGLGNLWAFPYKLYSFGGGAFLIPYMIALFLVGMPLMILEFSLGHFTQRAAPDAFGTCNRRFEIAGWWGIIFGFVIVTYYPVILAYCFSFLGFSIKGILSGGALPWSGEGIEGVEKAKSFFNNYLGYRPGPNLGPIQWNIVLPLIISWFAMYLCIFKGVRLVGRIVWLTVPLPWLMLLILTIRGLTLPGSIKGLAYYLDPVWSELAKPTTWRYAFGAVFFSLSLGFGVMITYASFLHRRSDLNNNAVVVSLADFATSFVCGLAIFATLGAMAHITTMEGTPVQVENVVDQGPGLTFVAFPYALAQLPYSAWFSFIFFFALLTLGIDSAFSITESVLASLVDKTGWPRAIVLPVMSMVGLLLGLVYTTRSGLDWIFTIDGFVNGSWGIVFMGLLECVVLGWLYRVNQLRRHANDRSDWRLGRWWDYLIRIIIPIILGSLFLWNLFDDFTQQGGFFVNNDSKLIVPNIIGMAVIVIVPVLSLLISVCRWRGRPEPAEMPEQAQTARGKLSGTIALIFSLIPIPVIVFVACGLVQDSMHLAGHMLMLVCLLLAIGAVLSGNNQLGRYDTSTTRASWLGRWAGLLGVLDISAVVAVYLINLTRYHTWTSEKVVTDVEKLSGISYIILAIVLLLIIGGLGWCFYRALTAASKSNEIQTPQAVGDEQ